MKKKILALLMAGMMIGSLTACGGASEVTEDPTPVIELDEDEDEDQDDSEEVVDEEDEEEEMISPDHVFDIPEGVWKYGKSFNCWVVTEGLFWHLVDSNGDTAVEGTLYATDEDTFDVFDENGNLYTTFSITEDGDLFDETYMELYYAVDHLPEKFPGELADEIGFNDIAGDWIYQEQDTEDYENYNDVAFIQIFQDGTYTIRFYDDDSERNGVILIQLEEFPDGSSTPVYTFLEGGNNFWQGAYVGEREVDEIYFGNGGSARLIPAEGQG